MSTFRKWEWLEEVKKYDVDAIAEALGLKVVRGHGNALALTPCPCCNAEIRGGKDKTGPVGLRSDREGWRCHRCDKAGDGIGLVVAVVTGNPTLSAGAPDWRDVHNRCAHAGLCDVPFSGDGPVIPRIAVRPQRPTFVSKIWLDADRSAELVAFWNSCGPVSADPDVSRWLESRRLDQGAIDAAELARALPFPYEGCPRWARKQVMANSPQRANWATLGYRCLIPVYNSQGELASLRARRVIERDDELPKSLAPTGATLSGLVMADPLGRALLEGTASDVRELVITEGEPDFLTWCINRRDTDEHPPAVWGVVAGSWREDSEQLAARVPDGCTVVIRTHADAPGDKYAQAIYKTLKHRNAVTVMRAEREDAR